MLGRIVISRSSYVVLWPGDVYHSSNGSRLKIKCSAAALFVVMRNIADGVRLLLTAFVLTAVYTAFQPQADADTIIVASIVLIGIVMIIFTYFGGMEAVIWVEVVQLGIYIAGAIAAAIVLINLTDGGWNRFAPARNTISSRSTSHSN